MSRVGEKMKPSVKLSDFSGFSSGLARMYDAKLVAQSRLVGSFTGQRSGSRTPLLKACTLDWDTCDSEGARKPCANVPRNASISIGWYLMPTFGVVELPKSL